MTLALDTLSIHHPKDYARRGPPWAAWDLLRKTAPVYWYVRDDIEPFWAVTRYSDIMTVSNHPEVFINGGPRLRLTLKGKPELLRAGTDTFGAEHAWDPNEPPDMVFMDNPRHRRYRRLTSWAYTQGAMRAMAAHFRALADGFTAEFITRLEMGDPAGVDLVDGLACKLPLAAVGEIMGLARDDWKQILVWSKALVGEVDAADCLPGESRGRAAYRNMYELRAYIEDLIEDARRHGAQRGGLIDRMVHSKVEGQWLTNQQLNGYIFLLIGAGNDTTRNAIAGGVAALIEHPEQCARLCAEPQLLHSAVEEILRWTSPVASFLRTATRDVELGGERIRVGDTVGVFYPSANRDAQVFQDPYRFDITRSPNPHLTFGYGAHFCLGTNLARVELAASLAALLPSIGRFEFAGAPTRLAQTHVMGYSTLPIRLRSTA
jgi:cytochrome P450